MEYPLWLMTVISIGFLLVGLYYSILGISGITKSLSQHDWLSTEAKITHCEIIPLRNLLRSQPVVERMITLLGLISAVAELLQPGTARVLCMVVSFEYTILGTSFVAKEQLKRRMHYQPGDIVKCLVNPSKLTEASIKVNIGFTVLYLLVGIALLGISIAMLILF